MPTVLTLRERVLLKVVKRESGCWEWQGCTNKGYGTIGVGGRADKKDLLTHRVMWEETNGPITDPNMCVLHKCDNPPCVNPDHLFLGTRTKNAEDKVKKGRQSRGKRGGNGKVTEEMVLEIRRRYDNRKLVSVRTSRGDPDSMSSLAKEFGIHAVTVFDIVHRKTWNHIA